MDYIFVLKFSFTNCLESKTVTFLCHFWEACCDDGHSCVPENFICAALCMLLHRLVLYKIPLILEKTVSDLEVSSLSKIVCDVLLAHCMAHRKCSPRAN